MLAGPLQAFASPCGTLTALAEPIAVFTTHCGIITALPGTLQALAEHFVFMSSTRLHNGLQA